MNFRIEVLPEKLLMGKSIRMSLTDNKTREVWRSFMTAKATIKNPIGTDLYSLQIYSDTIYFQNFSALTEFTKWAAIEVRNAENIPNGFGVLSLQGGLYAVFLHKGAVSEFQKTMHYIFSQWLPRSEFELDDRPHFELLGEKYKNNSPDSEEEVWIPIREKA